MILRALVTALLTAIALLAPVPAQATTCVPLTNICDGGDIGHTTDNGYDAAIIVFCRYKDVYTDGKLDPDWSKDKRVAEGKNSQAYCGIDTDIVWVRTNEQIACRETDRFGNHSWPVRFDAQGPHKINDFWHEGWCVVQRD